VTALWRDHSLTIVLALTGAGTLAFASLFEDRLWDLFSGLGQGILTTGLVFWSSRYFRETAKPEDPPE